MDSKNYPIKAYSKKEMTNMYGIHRFTFLKWIKKIPEIEINRKRLFTPKEVEIIFNHLGPPEKDF
jgi:transposase